MLRHKPAVDDPTRQYSGLPSLINGYQNLAFSREDKKHSSASTAAAIVPSDLGRNILDCLQDITYMEFVVFHDWTKTSHTNRRNGYQPILKVLRVSPSCFIALFLPHRLSMIFCLFLRYMAYLNLIFVLENRTNFGMIYFSAGHNMSLLHKFIHPRPFCKAHVAPSLAKSIWRFSAELLN